MPARAPVLIGLDWGTSSARAYAFAADGAVLGESAAPLGILHLGNLSYPDALRRLTERWAEHLGRVPVLAAGMVGSRQGWREAPYVDCPASLARIAAGVVPVETDVARVSMVPGLLCAGADGSPDVIRGEETQVAGLDLEGTGLVVLPGTHSKWVRTEGRTVADFATFMTGEVYAVLLEHSILGRLATGRGSDPGAFREGVAVALRSSRTASALLHDLFTARTRALAGTLPQAGVSDYLSGVLIGSEIASALRAFGSGGATVVLVGEPGLCARYREALALAGREARVSEASTTARGLWRIAVAAAMIPDSRG